MNVIKVKFSIDIDNVEQLNSFNAFVTALKGNGGTTPIVEAPVKDIKAPAQQTAPTQQAAPAPITSTGSKKLDEIRKLIALKAGEHRVAMKAKLAEFGANTATDLTVDKYDEFHAFLDSL